MATIKARDELASVIPYPLGPPPENLQEELGFPRIIRMGDNENPYGASPFALEAVKKELDSINRYPDGTYSRLYKSLSSFHGLSEGYFTVGNGSDEVIRLITRAFISRGDEAVMASCTFPRYKTNVLIEGGIPVEVPLVDGIHDLDGMLSSVSARTKMVFVCNPNNPTGTIVDKDALAQFISAVPENVLIVVDEAYVEYVRPGAMNDAKSILEKHRNVVILRTFSKIHGLAGLRIGYGMMCPGISENLAKVRDVFNVNRAGAAAAAASLGDVCFIAESAEKNKLEREYVTKRLEEIGYQSLPSEANFLFVPLNEPGGLIELTLAGQGIFVKAISAPGYPGAFRAALGTREENDRFLGAIRSFQTEGVMKIWTLLRET
ncbi:histidinol-phosphate transaminase [Bacillus sp. FJAT-27445]|uniref:histidinol-phosphate transaminase n=1 Tax=Bacillus sp. FJAT-27445 TaxID=1679166 RepID=UPI0007435EFA|nr:histidinol-phosphate transaminase [Bacillus sp. FJAT-27445]